MGLEEENRKLKKLLAESMLDVATLCEMSHLPALGLRPALKCFAASQALRLA